MKVNGSAFAGQEEVEVKREKTFIWRPTPRKDLTESVVEQVSSPEDSDDLEDFASENEDWDSVSKSHSASHFPEMTPLPPYEEEDWDKELADIENSKNPYDLDDVIPYGGFLDGNSEASCTVQESLYDPSLYHVAPLTLSPLEAVTEDGQFEDALD